MATERRLGAWLLWGSVAILLAALGAWALEHFERQTLEIDQGFSKAARRNDFLAAEHFLRRLGRRVESRKGQDRLRQLPPPTDLLVVKSLGALTREQQQALGHWLEAGGRLLAAPAGVWEEDSLEARTPREDFFAAHGVRRQIQNHYSLAGARGKVRFEGYPESLEIDFSPRYFLVDLQDHADGSVLVDDLYRLLQYKIGAGQLTVVSDMSPFTNSHIGEHDHALVLARLVESAEDGKIWLLYDEQVPWLSTLLWQQGASALIAAAALLTALLWRLGRDLGPRLPSPPSGRRDLLDHLQALGDFHWRHGCADALVQGSRARIEQAWLRRHPALRALAPAARAAWLARHAGRPEAQIREALYPAASDAPDLLEQARQLQHLWHLSLGSGKEKPGAAARESPRRRQAQRPAGTRP